MALADAQCTANRAAGSGGFAHFVGILSATIDGIVATGNEAGDAGGAFAVIDSIRAISNMTDSSVNFNRAGSKGGGLYIEDAVVSVTGTQFRDNFVDQGDGGASATSGALAQLSFADRECVAVEVVLDWSTAGGGCSIVDDDGRTCDYWAASCVDLQNDHGYDCSGCACK